MKEYLDAVRRVLQEGQRKENRTGVDTISTLGVHYNIDFRRGFPLLTTKAVSWKNLVVEVLWFLSGSRNVDFLHRHGCKFWDSWVDADGNIPASYGPAWRSFPTPEGSNDQIAWAVETLQKTPNSRRVVVSAWAPGVAQVSALPPCHLLWVFNTQNLLCHKCLGEGSYPIYDPELGPDYMMCQCSRKPEPHLCLHLTQRSADMALGVPYNIASYSLLLSLFARFAGLKPGLFSHTLVDAHVYTAKPDGSMAEHDHVPGLREQLLREPKQRPKLVIDPSIRELADVERLIRDDVSTEELLRLFRLDGYYPWPAIPFKVAV